MNWDQIEESKQFIGVRLMVHHHHSRPVAPQFVHDAEVGSRAVFVLCLSFVWNECAATVVIHYCMDVGGCCK